MLHTGPADIADWLVIEDAFEPERLGSAESIFAVGNGRFTTRGSFEERYPGDTPATLAHGVWGLHPLAATELVNLPDWTALDIFVNGCRFSLADGELLRYWRMLDLRTGLLRRNVTWRSPDGASVELGFERFASFADDRFAALRLTVTALDEVDRIEVHAGLDANADTDGRTHLSLLGQDAAGRAAAVRVAVRGADANAAMAMRLDPSDDTVAVEAWNVRGRPTIVSRWAAHPGQTVMLNKVVTIESCREPAGAVPAASERLATAGASTIDEVFAESVAAWRRAWERSDVVIEGDHEAQLAIRFAIYHLLVAAPRDNGRSSIPAKTLSGFGYRGHVFWDMEAFMLPWFIHTHPDIARDLLSYRFKRLAGARRKAAAGGFDGAQFPWESADDGTEVTPALLPHAADPTGLIRIWTGDIEIHISSIIALAVMRYWSATGDESFMLEQGAELVLETARFWASRAEWNAECDRYELHDVIGPDEYHDHVDNNAFTNYLVAWHLRTAAEIAAWLVGAHPARAAALLGPPERARSVVDRFRAVAEGIYLPIDPVSGLIEQFDGYFDRRDVDLAEYAGRQRSMQSILGTAGVAETTIIKQPDVLMLAHLLPDLFDLAALGANYAWYDSRTDHEFGSSLGPAISALVAARVGRLDEAYAHFVRAARIDLADDRLNGADGVHAAALGGLWQSIVFGFAGVAFDGDSVVTRPRLPTHWTRLAFSLVHRGRVVDVDLRSASRTPIRGLILDLDGVLANTAEAHYRAWQRLADEEGLPFDRVANEALRGVSRRESLRRLLGARSVTAAQADAFMARKNRYYREQIASLTPDGLLPGALELLDAAAGRGLPIALASASRNAREVVERLGIASRFDCICDGHSVQAAKPAPDVFLAAAAGLGLAPATCLVFEDAADGIAAAHAAGMLAVGVGSSERLGAADVVVENLAAADLDAILVALSGGREVAA